MCLSSQEESVDDLRKEVIVVTIQYKVYEKSYEDWRLLRKGELIGVLTERREMVRASDSVLMSGLKWARSVFGKMARVPDSIFVVRVSDDERGASTVEYAILVVMVAAMVILGASVFGRIVQSLFIIKFLKGVMSDVEEDCSGYRCKGLGWQRFFHYG